MTVRVYKRRRLKDRYWEKVDVRGSNECWPWLASKTPAGYGKIKIDGRARDVGAHRIAWELHYGRPVPEGFLICHKCDNRECQNPAHLFLGTHADNVHDMVSKGRHVSGFAVHRERIPEVPA